MSKRAVCRILSKEEGKREEKQFHDNQLTIKLNYKKYTIAHTRSFQTTLIVYSICCSKRTKQVASKQVMTETVIYLFFIGL
jgi:hypothetical protein